MFWIFNQQFTPLIGVIFFTLLYADTVISQTFSEELEANLEKIDKELNTLSRMNFRYGVGNIGWLSSAAEKPSDPQWVEIKLPVNSEFDAIVLVPMLWDDPLSGPVADAFPKAFQIRAGKEGEAEGQIIARQDIKDNFLPRVAPLVISIPKVAADWVRVESISLTKDRRANRNMMAFSEIMVFDEHRNLALRQPVTTSSITGGWGAQAIQKQALTDGVTPYQMHAAGNRSNSYLCFFQHQKSRPSVIVDLEEKLSIDEIHLHYAGASEQIPRIHEVDFGIPFKLSIEAANREDFSDSFTLCEVQRGSVYDVGPIYSHNLSGKEARFIKLSVISPYTMPAGTYEFAFGLAELLVISNGNNVALDKPVLTSPRRGPRHENRLSIVDGSNHYGATLSIRDWMEELAQRHELEKERPKIVQAIQSKYDKQKAKLNLMYWLIAILAVVIVSVVLFDRMLRLRAVLRTRERIAANIHDELSANLQALVILSDMAKSDLNNLDKLPKVIDRIHRIARRNRKHTRLLMRQLQTDTNIDDLESEMRRSADRLVSDLEQHLELTDIKKLVHLSQRKKNDFFLFFQECLINIARHADATSVWVTVDVFCRKLQLTVCDNGTGITEEPPSLSRRARFLSSQVRVSTPEGGGTRIILTVPLRKKNIVV